MVAYVWPDALLECRMAGFNVQSTATSFFFRAFAEYAMFLVRVRDVILCTRDRWTQEHG